jgi:uncharacterized protein YjbJ (UPF0337 family)
MEWVTIKGKWNQTKGEAKKRWGRLTDNDLTVISGEKDRLVGKLQEAYGIAKDEAEKQVKDFERDCAC